MHSLIRPLVCGALVALAIPGPASARSFSNSSQAEVIPKKLEKMYQRGLQWLATNQGADGSWGHIDSNFGSNPGVVGLAVMALVSRGDDPNTGLYAENVRKAVDFIIAEQNTSSGLIGSRMYDHGFATTALAEVYGELDHPGVGQTLQKAVDLILKSQSENPTGGWRYDPGSTDADTSVVGCQMVALFAARNAGLMIPDVAFERGLAYLASVRTSEGGYGYSNASNPNPTRGAIGHLMYSLAKQRDDSSYKSGLAYLKKNLKYRDQSYPFYYEYYMAQALFHADSEVWSEWNNANIGYMSTIQLPDGSWTSGKGSTFSTSAALLSLALNYRYLPIYER
ncbi:prenyltransferase/squalene oxidase repeat-containing protein [Sulfuriroseicoccus oceanibius]|uniref:Terpene cyclase/mutase family protein n=1 Tax=Sulfuriroseicoccus oceanibius TaxID=2707525 RepID=A0A7T7JB94_9BACT|nr:prenyltransferase/squalene oxidase repeat-containing protein [Sulfuriroseicoccus oceanibius]QQL44033.1 terpene cyclase/mutase family protein [Sulfuriroseicoccus oceanibius]